MRSVVEIGATVPAFLGKLWKLVNDSETNHLISWSPGGKTFVIKNQADFARELLPLYYKHNNMASFIRQLNMYGFHKITSVENGGLRYEKDEIEFSHPCFMRGHAYLLEHIKRKIANPKSIVASNESGEKIVLKPELMNKVLSDVKQMKGKQESLDAKFSAMKQENEALWREVAILRQKHIKQQQIVNNLIQFLMSLVQPTRPGNANGNNVGVKRPYQLMINSAAHNADGYPGKLKNVKLDKDLLEDLNEDNLEEGPTIHELAHDDLLHNEASQDSVNAANFINQISPRSNSRTGLSPTNSASAVQYHVTMEDGEDGDNDANRNVYATYQTNGLLGTADSQPIVTSSSPTSVTTPASPVDNPIMITKVVTMPPGPSNPKSISRGNITKNTVVGGRTLLSPNSFNAINPSADLRLPAEIFASDDSVSDAGIGTTDEVQKVLLSDSLLATTTDPIISTSKDKMLGGINIKVEKVADNYKTNKKSKKTSNVDATANYVNIADIKTELQDDLDWNNMTLATVNNNTNVNRYPSVGDIDDHLDSMQTDLDSLRELLRTDSYTFDPSTLIGLFGADDPFYGLSYNPVDERPKPTNSAKKQKAEISNVSGAGTRVQGLYSDDAEGNQLISYTGNLPDLDDISIPELEVDNSQECVSPLPDDATLNTPQVEVRSPAYRMRP
ncbi:heat shock factor protein isoform X5 [Hyposmocoma kahamanoa]|uniref:heat shock factor protein isoform X5 n=1 Tax=Hyposmocoma kahamanoa TaxID=1477025 RepID=UPI000E6D991E|nr:heat shock factor protein isoform X5 [Hyposmocoma kahamanoa]